MANIVTFLTFKDHADEAAKFYCSIFPGARITNTVTDPVRLFELELFGQRYILLDGGEHFHFTEGVSLAVQCDTQDEIDRYWDALAADGGEPGVRGWLKDKFGLSWQIMPRRIAEIIGNSDPARAKRVMEAVMGMRKLDLPALERAAQGSSTESHGLGQSGYTAGRDRDAALERELASDYDAPRGGPDEDERVRGDLASEHRFSGY